MNVKCTNERKNKMKKTIIVAAAVAVMLTVNAFAEGADARKRPSPAGLALLDVLQFPQPDVDILGLRLNIIYGRNANVQGIDIGAFGSGVEGSLFGLQTSGILNDVGSSNGSLQIAGIVNICAEDFYGGQISGIANSTAQALYGGQVSVFNAAQTMYGTQIGVINKCGETQGLQIGLINTAEKAGGLFQIGLINVIKSNKNKFFPIINLGF